MLFIEECKKVINFPLTEGTKERLMDESISLANSIIMRAEKYMGD